MATVNETQATLRIMGEDLLPDHITELLGHKPTSEQVKGQVFKKNGKERIARSGMWRLEASNRTPGDLDAQIAEIFSQLTEDLSVWKTISERYRLDLFCGLFMGKWMEGISISSASLLILGEREVEIGLDIYGADENECNDA